MNIADKISKLAVKIHFKFYNAGLSGQQLSLYPNLNLTTTAEEEKQMIKNVVLGFHGCRNPACIDPIHIEATTLIEQLAVQSYRQGLETRAKIGGVQDE